MYTRALAVALVLAFCTHTSAQIVPVGGGVPGAGSITTEKIAAGAVTTEKIADAAVDADTKVDAAFSSVPYNSGNYVGRDSQTWTVEEADIQSHVILRFGKILLVSWAISASSVGGTPANQLRLSTGGYTWAKGCDGVHTYIDGASTRGAGRSQAVAGTDFVVLFIASTGNWSAATNTAGSFGSIMCEVV